ncbi:retropepsin-like aspartic protease family protein [Zhongshania marina]|uniref:TIGR02281 family clan AA aspartic protease n=1 Tax=Zhongshania marina TaxID=2304603 RepID=A0ABX9W3F3_9GAMM|nr:TIGR02281 family clan AA aspartic protease [Zhongshania marina]
MINRLVLALLCLCFACVAANAEPLKIVVRGLFENAALLEIDGRQQLLRAGQRDSSGVLVVSANPAQTVLEIDGKRKTLGLNKQIGTIYREPARAGVSLHKNNNKEYRTRVTINGRSADAVVDTGATSVAMSSRHAEQLGIAYKNGTATAVATAGGVKKAFGITLGRVDVGDIKTQQIAAVVIEGEHPHVILLGMSFLEHIDLQERDNILVLTPRY